MDLAIKVLNVQRFSPLPSSDRIPTIVITESDGKPSAYDGGDEQSDSDGLEDGRLSAPDRKASDKIAVSQQTIASKEKFRDSIGPGERELPGDELNMPTQKLRDSYGIELASDTKGVSETTRTMKPEKNASEEHHDLLESLEQTMLPFMPPGESQTDSTSSVANKSDTSKDGEKEAQKERIPSPPVPGKIETPKVEDNVEEFENLETSMLPFMLPTDSQTRDTPLVVARIDSLDAIDGRAQRVPTPNIPSQENVVQSEDNIEGNEVETPPPLPPRPAVRRESEPPNVNNRHPVPHIPSIVSLRSSLTQVNRPTEPTSESSPDLSAVVQMASIWTSLLEEELLFLDRMDSFRTLFYTPIIAQSPKLADRLQTATITDQMVQKHRQHLLNPMLEITSGDSSPILYAALFESWTNQTQQMYYEYCRRLPDSESVIKTVQATNPNFTSIQNALKQNSNLNGQSWEELIRLPIAHLNVYTAKLRTALQLLTTVGPDISSVEYTDTAQALHLVRSLRGQCFQILESKQNRDQLHTLQHRLQIKDPEVISALNLRNPERRLILQGSLALKTNGHGPWHTVHAILLDNYFLWATDHSSSTSMSMSNLLHSSKSNTGQWRVTDIPIPRSTLQVSTADQSHLSTTAGSFDDVPKGTTLYQIFVKNAASPSKPHTLGTYTMQDYQMWWQCLSGSPVPVNVPTHVAQPDKGGGKEQEQKRSKGVFDRYGMNRLPSSKDLRASALMGTAQRIGRASIGGSARH